VTTPLPDRPTPIARLRDRIAARLATGFLGDVARHAVRRHPFIWDRSAARICIASNVVLNDALFNTESGSITIANDVFLGHGVSLLTGTHDHTQFGRARRAAVPRSGRDIIIDKGAWVASNATILGPCRIGEHAVVAAGAVVVEDVPAYAVVGGVPARLMLRLERP
jgi:acetyltransferase-like isoleucine patch superfamily enzyme